ncbi:MAG TPA: hypothetical protein VK689_18810 [Armatimonadota bacterium]|nr:hypothetical protein [Armatimonadota bacterium]
MTKNTRIPALFAFALVPSLLLAAGAHGGKAEPRRVKFKPGSSSATLVGTLREGDEYEYVLSARQGQWMTVEAAATPRDAAAFVLTDPSGEATPPRYGWAGALPRTGDYLLRVFKFPDYAPSSFTLTVTVGARPPAAGTGGAEEIALRRAMRKFIDAFRNRDRTAFLASFSRAKPFYQLNPINIGSKQHFRTAVPYSRLAADVRRKTGLYWTYLERGENGTYDAFVDHVQRGTMWTRAGKNMFVPPDAEAGSLTYVRWRRERGRWVVDEISYPEA